jgi:hypothetical protein
MTGVEAPAEHSASREHPHAYPLRYRTSRAQNATKEGGGRSGSPSTRADLTQLDEARPEYGSETKTLVASPAHRPPRRSTRRSGPQLLAPTGVSHKGRFTRRAAASATPARAQRLRDTSHKVIRGWSCRVPPTAGRVEATSHAASQGRRRGEPQRKELHPRSATAHVDVYDSGRRICATPRAHRLPSSRRDASRGTQIEVVIASCGSRPSADGRFDSGGRGYFRTSRKWLVTVGFSGLGSGLKVHETGGYRDIPRFDVPLACGVSEPLIERPHFLTQSVGLLWALGC